MCHQSPRCPSARSSWVAIGSQGGAAARWGKLLGRAALCAETRVSLSHEPPVPIGPASQTEKTPLSEMGVGIRAGRRVVPRRTSYEYAALEAELDASRALRNDRGVADAAIGAIRELAARSGRLSRVPPTEALIAAAVGEHGALAVLHRDAHSIASRGAVFESVELPAS